MTRSTTDIRSTVLQAVAEIAPEFDVAGIDPTRPLRDEVELDSLDVLQLLGNLELRLGTTLPVSARADRASLDELVVLLEQHGR